MLADTGASVSAFNLNVYSEHFREYPLAYDNSILRSYSGNFIKPVGYFTAVCSVNNISRKVKFYVVDNGGPNIVGRPFLSAFKFKLKMNFDNVYKLSNIENNIVQKFPEVFSNRLGAYKFEKMFKPDTKPIFLKHRPMALAYRKQVEQQLEAMVRDGVLEPVSSSRFATPIVPVLKADGTIRVCEDFKSTINRYFDRAHHYPLPRISEIFAELNGGQLFTKLDLNKAYTQFLLDEKSQEITTITTHVGLFKNLRMPFGITPASSIFQQKIEQLFKGMKGVVCYIDDILVTGENLEAHIKNLEMVLTKLKEAGLTLRLSKCEFFKEEVEYLGHLISKEGLKKSQKRSWQF